jgi:hypothetical protein
MLEFVKVSENKTKRDLVIKANAFELLSTKEIYLYSVTFDPPLDLQNDKKECKLSIKNHLNPPKENEKKNEDEEVVYIFNNTLLYVVGKRLKKEDYPATDFLKFRLILKLIKVIQPYVKEYLFEWVSVVIEKMLIKNQHFFHIKMKLLNPLEKVDISPMLELYRGSQFIPYRGFSQRNFILIKKIQQIFRKDTALDYYKRDRDGAMDDLVESNVVTKYNNKINMYIVRDVLEKESPNKVSFKRGDKEITV